MQPPAAPTPKAAPAPTYTQGQVDASLAANPNASKGGYEGPPMGPQYTPAPPTNPFSSDPGYSDASSREQLGNGTISDQLKNLIAQRIVQYGDPSLAQQAGFDLDPQAAAFARQNYLSGNGQLARLDRSHNQNRTAIINALAAHGMVFSGDTGYQTGQEDKTYGNNVYDAQQSALADILGYRNQAQSQRDALHAATVAALQNAFQNYATNPAAYGQLPTQTPSTTAPPVAPPTSSLPNQGTGPYIGTLPTAIKKALVNPYTTGQKRFG
jgi:hypothetical protein